MSIIGRALARILAAPDEPAEATATLQPQVMEAHDIYAELGADWAEPELHYNCLLRVCHGVDLEATVPGIKVLAQDGNDMLVELPSSSKEALALLDSQGLVPEPEAEIRFRLLEQAQVSPDSVLDIRRLFR